MVYRVMDGNRGFADTQQSGGKVGLPVTGFCTQMAERWLPSLSGVAILSLGAALGKRLSGVI